jgi:hypothetical protein
MRRFSIAKRGALIFILSIFCLCPRTELAAQDDFRLVGPIGSYSTSQERYLGIYPVPIALKIPHWVRNKNTKLPGDYFQPPLGADTTALNDAEFSEIESLLVENIYSAFYDDFVLQNTAGYEYTLEDSAVTRREYHISYARGDTIYVISGWLGKFFSFYRAIPGDFRYDAGELQREIRKISLSYQEAKDNAFRSIQEEYNYLLEYVDVPNKMRVRNYQIDAQFTFGVPGNKERRYNLIEITKFIDPEAMP